MPADFNKVIPSILAHEGGFVNDPDDPGGITNFGITLKWLRQFEPLANENTITNMKREEAISRYHDYIWKLRGYDRLNSSTVAEKVLDMAINFGEQRGHTLAQQAANIFLPADKRLKEDGDLGPKSIAAINGIPAHDLTEQMKVLASDRYNRIVLQRPQSFKFLKGWLRRAGCALYSKCRTCVLAGLRDEDVG